MPDFRVYCAPSEANSSQLRLSAEESHHLVVVNRARRGDPVVAFDGRGTEWLCELEIESKTAAQLGVRSVSQAKPLGFDISLAQALPKGPAMEAIVRKATEIGARAIFPIESERTQVHLEGDRQGKKTEKWQTAALEAAKQCGNPWLPAVQPIQSFTSLVAASEGYDLKLIASLQAGAKWLKQVLASHREREGRVPERVLWLIGPEGDFSPAEVTLAIAHAFQPVTLGPLVLRCETAAVYALSVLSYELQNPAAAAAQRSEAIGSV